MVSSARARSLSNEGEELGRELRKHVAGEVRFDAYSRLLYSTDASIYQMDPVGVVIPKNRDDVLAVMELAARLRIPVLPRCGGTSLAGQTVNHAIVMDFSKYMDQVLEVNAEERWARVQPGIVLDELNRRLAPMNLQYAPDPTTSSRACVGGGIGNNTCGSHSVIYGKTVDHVKELTAVLSDGSVASFGPVDADVLQAKLAVSSLEGQIYRDVMRIAEENREEVLARYPKIMRRVSGYNLDEPLNNADGNPFNMARVVVGSEGTFCVITEAKINLVPVPAKKGLAVLHFEDMVRACEATWEILKHQPATVELIGRMILDRCRESLGFSRLLEPVDGEPDALLVVEFSGETEAEVVGKIDGLKQDMARKGLGYACVKLTDPRDQANIWSLRAAGLGLLMSTRGDAKPLPYVEDTAVDPEHLGQFVARFDQVVKAHDTQAGYYGHASVGCMHIRPLVNLKNSEGIQRMVSIASDIGDLVLEYGGSFSGEHGDGIVRGVWTEKMFGPAIYNAFRDMKRAFDPHGIMNPGKIIDCPPMTENLRFGTEYRTQPLTTTFDFSKDGGYGGAVEMCNGMGACRKLTGSMCPSYMATKEEEHSTRGRANLLRAVLSGSLPGDTMASKRLYDALDLCLECKACKAECQTGVDMAKLKYEFLDHYQRANGVSLRSKLFANINLLSSLGSHLGPFAGIATGNPLTRFFLHRFLGIHPNRKLPPQAAQTFPRWFRSRSSTVTTSAKSVVLFNDTFMNYNYPQVGKAAVDILEHAGFNVELADSGCCGRPMISKGLLSQAKSHARANVDHLYSYAERGIPIVGCEPSCLLTLRDEYPDLLRDDKAKMVAENSFMIDEFLMMLHEKNELELRFSELKKKVLFHGHCHQKALVGTRYSMALLRLPSSYEVEEIDAGCCGMAGSFGYEVEHYQVSMDVGRLKLFPAVESKDESWEVATMGVSCRQQLEHGAGRRSRHLVEILRDAVLE